MKKLDQKTEFLLNALTALQKQIEGTGVFIGSGRSKQYDRARAIDVCKVISENFKNINISADPCADNLRIKYPDSIGIGSFSICLMTVEECINDFKTLIGYDHKIHLFGSLDSKFNLPKKPKKLSHIGFDGGRPLLEKYLKAA